MAFMCVLFLCSLASEEVARAFPKVLTRSSKIVRQVVVGRHRGTSIGTWWEISLIKGRPVAMLMMSGYVGECLSPLFISVNSAWGGGLENDAILTSQEN
jgi:hypothetical protein